MDGEQARDDPADTPETQFTFYKVIDIIQTSMKDHFEKNRPLLKFFALFAPSQFPQLLTKYKTSHDLQRAIKAFCEVYSLNSFRCAAELLSFAATLQKFNSSRLMNESGRWDESDDEKTFENSDDSGGDDNCSDPEMSEGNKHLGRETSSKVMKTVILRCVEVTVFPRISPG